MLEISNKLMPGTQSYNTNFGEDIFFEKQAQASADKTYDYMVGGMGSNQDMDKVTSLCTQRLSSENSRPGLATQL